MPLLIYALNEEQIPAKSRSMYQIFLIFFLDFKTERIIKWHLKLGLNILQLLQTLCW